MVPVNKPVSNRCCGLAVEAGNIKIKNAKKAPADTAAYSQCLQLSRLRCAFSMRWPGNAITTSSMLASCLERLSLIFTCSVSGSCETVCANRWATLSGFVVDNSETINGMSATDRKRYLRFRAPAGLSASFWIVPSNFILATLGLHTRTRLTRGLGAEGAVPRYLCESA